MSGRAQVRGDHQSAYLLGQCADYLRAGDLFRFLEELDGDVELVAGLDAVELAGVVWKCAGYQVEDRPRTPRVARFADGTTVELRGIGGRLIDMAGAYAPD